jgi:SNF2 family DNA or RNA helicase
VDQDPKLLEHIRDIRTKDYSSLKSSPYLRGHFINEYGENSPVVLRNYQKQAIMNLLISERLVLGDDTGLGKTLEMLSAIGYIWMKEPEYVPIIITSKSALFQWESETRRFMQDMEAVTVHGKPFERHGLYEEFFMRHDENKKRLLILSYDMIMYDMNETVIKEKKKSPRKGFAKEMDIALDNKKSTLALFEAEKEKFDLYFKSHPWQIHQYLADYIKYEIKPIRPSIFTDQDAQYLTSYWTAREEAAKAESKLKGLRDEAAPPKRVMGIIDYVESMKQANPNAKFILVMDEMHKLKNHKSQFHEKVDLLAKQCSRLYGLTATPVKNRLMEFWALFRIIQPALLSKITKFQDEFCHMKLQPIGGGRQVKVVVGYKNLEKFVEIIEPFYLSRKKHDVAKELPQLISKEIECELSDIQEELYDLAETGLLNKSEDPDAQNADLLSAMVMCQQAVDAPQLLEDENGVVFEGPSSKIDALIELLQTEASDEKVIIFSRFEKMISLIEKSLNRVKIACTRITGKENSALIREKNKNLFQDMKSGVNVILITTAGSESLNLHSAAHFALIDLPWSWGDYLQLIGRALRIGSTHQIVVAHHFLGRKQNEKKTIDHQVLKALRSKKKLADKVAGANLIGGLKFEDNSTTDILSGILQEMDKATPESKPKKQKIARKSTKIGIEDEAPMAITTIDLSDV